MQAYIEEWKEAFGNYAHFMLTESGNGIADYYRVDINKRPSKIGSESEPKEVSQ